MLKLLATLLFVGAAYAQYGVYQCPPPWFGFQDKCYKFEMIPFIQSQAQENCANDGGSLLSINSQAEQNFVTNWLQASSPVTLEWYTSGLKKFSGQQGQEITFSWKGDGTDVQGAQYWLPNIDFHEKNGTNIIYKNIGQVWGWSLGAPSLQRSFICEVSKAESYKIMQQERGFDYGLPSLDVESLERGPKFTIQPETIIFEPGDKAVRNNDIFGYEQVATTKLVTVSFNCEAEGLPYPEYDWFIYRQQARLPVDPMANPKYTIGNRRLVINDPKDSEDNGQYECIAKNSIGAVRSVKATLRFGYLNNFPDTPRDPLYANSYRGAAIECDPPKHGYNRISYSWYKDLPNNFIFTDKKPHAFLSNDGKLYFSHVTRDDEGYYTCIVVVPGIKTQGKHSQPIELVVRESGTSEFEPDIVNGFPKVFPSSPLKGDNVSIECIAYGTSPISYSWSRLVGGQLPPHAELRDRSRVLYIPNAQVEDGGSYKCRATREYGQSDEEPVDLDIKAKPFFTIQLRDQHVDEGSDLTWRCYGGGKPSVAYQWWRNAEPLVVEDLLPADQERFSISNNVLTIKKVSGKRDAGMYQCSLENTYGKTFSSAQLRVLSFAPSFEKSPLQPNQYASLTSNTTILCRPEAAPQAELMWYKNDRPLTSSGRVAILPNGNLHITRVQQSDEGTYKCKASNKNGEAESVGKLTILSKTQITFPPKPVKVVVNSTAFMLCDAAYNPALDITYDWWHNNYRIEFERIEVGSGNVAYFEHDPHFVQGTGINQGGLYIKNVQLWHEGDYTCVTKTSSDELRQKSLLNVVGPPSPPAGVVGAQVTKNTIKLSWWPGANNGGEIKRYIIEAFDLLEEVWRKIKTNIPAGRGRVDEMMKDILVDDLSPGSQYKFRVRAVNEYGEGQPSDATEQIYTTDEDPPEIAPENVGGGGGKVGDLIMHWDHMPPAQHNGKGFGYIVAWKPKENFQEERWEDHELVGMDATRYVSLVGAKNFYRQYDVRVRAKNNAGTGPWSEIVIIYSAEGMPIAVPQDIKAVYYNSTAIEVIWTPVPETRAAIQGVLKGYRINYWKSNSEDESMSQFAIITGQTDHGLAIGLSPNTEYTVSVQSFNSAGLSSVSEQYTTRTLRSAPLEAPQEVHLKIRSSSSVEVVWRGVTTTIEEEPLEGYMIRFWRRGENIYVAKDFDALKKTRAYVDDLEENVMYEMRVLGYSRGGHGLQSSPTIEFILGTGCIVKEDSPDKEYIYKCGEKGSSAVLTCSSTVWALLLPLLVVTVCTRTTA